MKVEVLYLVFLSHRVIQYAANKQQTSLQTIPRGSVSDNEHHAGQPIHDSYGRKVQQTGSAV